MYPSDFSPLEVSTRPDSVSVKVRLHGTPREIVAVTPPGDEAARIRVDRDVPVPFLRSDEIEADLLARALVVVDAHADHARQGRMQRDREGRPVQGVAAPLDDLRRNRGAERSALRPQVIRLAPVQRVDSGAEHPESVGELHFSPGVAGMIAMRSASDMRMTAEPPGASASPFARSVEVSGIDPLSRHGGSVGAVVEQEHVVAFSAAPHDRLHAEVGCSASTGATPMRFICAAKNSSRDSCSSFVET